jgi:hypothetical protein
MWTWIAVVAIVIVLGGLLVWLAKLSRDADSELADMNKGRTNGPGVFGIFSKDHRRG